MNSHLNSKGVFMDWLVSAHIAHDQEFLLISNVRRSGLICHCDLHAISEVWSNICNDILWAMRSIKGTWIWEQRFSRILGWLRI